MKNTSPKQPQKVGGPAALDTKLKPPKKDSTLKNFPIFVDMSSHAQINGKALRVELRRVRDPAIGKVAAPKRLVDENCIIGLISPEDLPKEGKEFRMPYHSYNNFIDYGSIKSNEPVTDVLENEGNYYFSTSEGDWRLKILDAGN
jgi:hypothetical protein